MSRAASGQTPRIAAVEPDRRASAESIAAAVGLPAELASLVVAVAKGSRLWRSERADVARELCAHFLDGLESGASAGELRERFGDPKRAAKLIRAAKRRLRPLWWRGWWAISRGVAWTLVVCFAVYGLLAARFFLGSPTIARNYSAELNAPTLAAPESDRAWPLFVEAIRQFGPLPESQYIWTSAKPDSPTEEETAAFTDANPEAMAMLRRAAGRPMMGYIYRDIADPEYMKALVISRPAISHSVPGVEKEHDNPMMVSVMLPHLGQMRVFSKWLAADARLAASRGDGGRAVEDVDAMLNIAQHMLSERFLIANYVGVAVAMVAADAGLEIAGTRGLLTDEQLQSLSHRFAGFAGGRIRLDPGGDRIMLEDTIQRFYSDDGNGDGRFVGGDPTMEHIFRDWGVVRPKAYPLMRAFQPVQSVVLPSRRTLNAMIDRFVAEYAADEALPPWKHDQRRSDESHARIMETGIYPVAPVVKSLMGGNQMEEVFSNGLAMRDHFEAKREIVLTVLALDAFARRNQRYPASLEELAPRYMPEIPLDPFDGKPLRYRAASSAEGRPLLYSIGADGVDDGGVPAVTREGRGRAENIRSIGLFRPRDHSALTAEELALREAARGDWVLWPVPVPLKE